MPDGSNFMLAYFFTYVASGTPCWRPRLIEIENASMIPASVEPCFATLMNTSPGRPSSYSPTVT